MENLFYQNLKFYRHIFAFYVSVTQPNSKWLGATYVKGFISMDESYVTHTVRVSGRTFKWA